MIYFIQNTKTSDIKIGSTSDLRRRLTELQTGNSSLLRVLYVIDTDDTTNVLSFEKHVQDVCSRYALHGEWFSEKVLTHLLNHPWFKENMHPPVRGSL